MRLTSEYSNRFDVIGTDDQPLNVLALKHGEQIEAKSLQIGKYVFEPQKRFTKIGSDRMTSSGFYSVKLLKGYEHEYVGLIEEWLCFQTWYKGKRMDLFKPNLFSFYQAYYWAMQRLDENTGIVFNAGGSSRLILLD